ncbi:MAG: sigma-70 family RNA polymerase sigma factor [Lachnospiraceae bacterium]|nr:sigma-70 family RNA polymerase sigma factor [Lachnospiraceae bacterium]
MQSQEELYQRYARIVYKYLLSKTRNEQLAEELTQETFYQAIKSIDRFDGSCRLSTWLCAIAKNQLLAWLRKHPAEEPFQEQTTLQSASAESEALQQLQRVELMKKLHTFPEPFREILYLRIFGNLSFREIGEIMGKTENWARVNYYRAKERLKKEVQKDE